MMHISEVDDADFHHEDDIGNVATEKWVEHTAPSNITTPIAACDLVMLATGARRQERANEVQGVLIKSSGGEVTEVT